MPNYRLPKLETESEYHTNRARETEEFIQQLLIEFPTDPYKAKYAKRQLELAYRRKRYHEDRIQNA